jgi:hypothetical protein
MNPSRLSGGAEMQVKSIIGAGIPPANGSFSYIDKLRDDAIRLLTIVPGSVDDLIWCALKTHNVKGCQWPEYEALSYVWGTVDPEVVRPWIHCNGRKVEVQPNLLSALKAIRQPEKHRTFWIDALCINQVDDEEKGFQVQLMREIYRKARGVTVFLGGVEDAHAAVAVEMC